GPANRPGSAVAPPSGTAGSSRVAGLGGPATSSGRPEPSPVIRYSHGPGGTGSSTTSLPCALTCRRPSREVTRRPVASGEPGGTVASTTPSVRATAQPKRTSISSGRWAVVVSSVDRGADGSSGQRTVGTSTSTGANGSESAHASPTRPARPAHLRADHRPVPACACASRMSTPVATVSSGVCAPSCGLERCHVFAPNSRNGRLAAVHTLCFYAWRRKSWEARVQIDKDLVAASATPLV